MLKRVSKNIRLVLDILQDEVNGDVRAALKKITKDYTMTWVNCGAKGEKLFPSSPETGKSMESELEEVYPIRGRQYDIRNIAEGDGVVVVELIESYPDSKTGKTFRTPLVLVLEMKNGKIQTGRHYLDPRISGMFLTKKDIGKAFKKSHGSLKIIK